MLRRRTPPPSLASRRAISGTQYRNRRIPSPIEEHRRQRRLQPVTYDCRICNKDHALRKCNIFKKMSVLSRLGIVKRYKYCENCLAHSHQMIKCSSIDRCKECGDRHHTLLHRTPIKVVEHHLRESETTTVIPTVIIKIRLNNSWAQVRGLLSPCNHISSIAAFIIDRYQIPVEKIDNDKWSKVYFCSRFDESETFSVRAKVTEDLPTPQPKRRLDSRVTYQYKNLRLADPDFFETHDINIILGADIYPQLIRTGIQSTSPTSPLAQDTKLGWTIIGKFEF